MRYWGDALVGVGGGNARRGSAQNHRVLGGPCGGGRGERPSGGRGSDGCSGRGVEFEANRIVSREFR